MCGVAGLLQAEPRTSDDALRAVAARMAATLCHRGPDDAGVWAEPSAGVALGFRRLSIIDTSDEGHQPMRSADGRYTVVFNGEVYNFGELRRELERRGHRLRGRSDTEVLLAAFVEWGVREALRRARGMLALAVWDAAARRLHLARDRLGKKPLYYGWAGDTLVFASELKALGAHPEFRAEVDPASLALFLRHGYIPAPHAIYRRTFKLPAGTHLELAAGERAQAPSAYWSLAEVAEGGQTSGFSGSPEDAVERLDELLNDAVRLRMIADVPLGAFLSGGTDSSLVVALMQAQSATPVRTFTVGFSEAGFDEAPAARAVAAHLGTEHTELYVSPAQAREVIPRLPRIYDEPFADSSQIPTFLVSELARRKVTVALSGDGGDELFGGYGRYFLAQRMWSRIERVPAFARPMVGLGVRTAASVADRLGLDGRGRRSSPGERGQRLAAMLAAGSREELYDDIVSVWPDPPIVALAGPDLTPAPERVPDANGDPSFLAHMMLRDGLTYLPDDILTKVDRASMAVSLEVRSPMLDHRVAEFAWGLPLDCRVHGSEGKWLLRRLLSTHLPTAIVERPKRGFDVPVAGWLRGPLREWSEGLLDERRLRDEGYLAPGPVRACWQEHLTGRRNWHQSLWAVLMFQAWLEGHVGGSEPTSVSP